MKEYVVYWTAGGYSNPHGKQVTIDFFDLYNGYERFQIDEIESLDIGDKYQVDDYHGVIRII